MSETPEAAWSTGRRRLKLVYQHLERACSGYGWRNAEFVRESLVKAGEIITVGSVREDLRFLRDMGVVEAHSDWLAQTNDALWKPRSR